MERDTTTFSASLTAREAIEAVVEHIVGAVVPDNLSVVDVNLRKDGARSPRLKRHRIEWDTRVPE
jgi:hypothetical protein